MNSVSPNNPACKICAAPTMEHAKVMVRGKYASRLLRCKECGLLSMENPAWLAEAYAEPINRSDTGYVWRNLWARDKIRECIERHLNPAGVFLDYAAGYGLFVRLMRDIGYDFRWADLYCRNLFCQGFEAPLPLVGPYEVVTAFEVFEHLPDPMAEAEKLLPITSCLIFSTKLVPEPVPQPGDWWYYGFEHGQHVAFYTRKSLEVMAQRFGFHFATDGSDMHVFSRKPVSPDFFSLPQVPRWRFWDRPKPLPVRPSLTAVDYDTISKQLLKKP